MVRDKLLLPVTMRSPYRHEYLSSKHPELSFDFSIMEISMAMSMPTPLAIVPLVPNFPNRVVFMEVLLGFLFSHNAEREYRLDKILCHKGTAQA